MAAPIPIFTPQEIARLRRVILDYEAGNLTNAVAPSGARQRQVQLNVFKIDTPAEGGGKYSLKLLQPNDGGTDDDIDDTSDLTAEDLGKEYDAPENVTYLGVYPPEVGTSDHNLDTSTPVVAMTRRIQTGDDSSGTKIVAIILGGGGQLPRPQYQYEVYQGVSQNQSGFAPLHATPMNDS